MDTPYKDRQLFSHVTGLLSVSSAEVSDPGSLTQKIIQQVSIRFWWHINVAENRDNNVHISLKAEAEVKRLDQLKVSKMKELFLKKQNELKEICKKSHMEIPVQAKMDNIINLMKSGEIHRYVLTLRMKTCHCLKML